MMMGYFFAACRNGNSSLLFRHVQLDYHRGDIIVPLMASNLKDVEALGLFDAVRLGGYNPEFCSLSLCHRNEITWSCYGGGSPSFPGYVFKNRQVYGNPPLRATNCSRTASGIVVDIPGEVVRPLKEIQFASIMSCEAIWFEASFA